MIKIIPVAYIDPGTGYVISTGGTLLITIILGFLGVVSLFFKRIFRFFRNNKRKVCCLLLVLLVLIGAIKMAMIHKKAGSFNGKIVIVGFDGLSPEILEPMMKEGKLPHFAKLAQQGSYRRLSTTNPAQTPVAFTSFATGQNPGKHGIFDFIKRDPKTYGLDLACSNTEKGIPRRVVKSKYFWEYASDLGVPSVILFCPVTFPPSKLKGRLLSGMGVPDILGTEGTFSFYTSEPLSSQKDTGGNVFKVEKEPVINLNLIGPKKALFGDEAENIKVPFTATAVPEQDAVIIELQNQKFQIKAGQWSGWKRATFPISAFKKMKGILQFYLVETSPEFKLYVSPINFDPSDPFFPISYPSGYARELTEHVGLFYTQGMRYNTWAVNEKRLSDKAFLEQVDQTLQENKAILDFELARFQKGILFTYFGFSDLTQHMFWRYIDPGHPLYEKDAPVEYKEVIKSCYQKTDEILGDVMGKIKADDLLIVLSDHGFNTFRRTVHLNSWLRENGYLYLKDPKAEYGAELLRDIDWSKTKAYAIGFGAIYINQKNREKNGVVNFGRETELLKKEIIEKLEKWVDPKYKQRVVSRVYPREKIFWGGSINDTPDLYVGFNVGYRASWQTAIGGVPQTTIEDNEKKWSGDHLFDPQLVPGIILTNRKLPDSPSIYDITPTILKIIGYSDAKMEKGNFDGKPLF